MVLPTADILQRAVGCGRGLSLTWEKPIREACALFDITTAKRLSAFLATVGHESMGLARTTENLNYSLQRLREVCERAPPGSRWRSLLPRASQLAHNPAALANAAYGGRMGNGPEGSGDGYRYRGRGLIQTTGRTNYEATYDLLRDHVEGVPDLVAQPDALAEPKWAALSAGAFWCEHELNELADANEFRRLSTRVNGGNSGMADRLERYELARAVLA